MSMGSGLKNLFIKLGKDNKPTLAAVCVASAKGIFRPIFTLSDKKQDKETKKYTAMREGLTELIAIPVYIGSGKLAECIANKCSKPKDMDKALYKQVLNGDSFVGTELEAKVKMLRKQIFERRTVLSMFGVFLAALAVIPAICSATIKPVMKLIQSKPQKDANNTNINKNTEITNIDKPSFKGRVRIGNIHTYNYTQSGNYGMKVGGIC